MNHLYPYRYMSIYKNTYLCITYIVLLLNTIFLSEIGSGRWLYSIYVPIVTTICIFILEVISTSQYNGKIQYMLSFYLVFPASISFVLLHIKEYHTAYNIIKINITISILYIVGIIIIVTAYLISKFYEKYYSKQIIRCDTCRRVYIVRNKEKRKLEKYRYMSKDPDCVIICQKCLNSNVIFERLSLAPDFIKINHKAKIVREVETKICLRN